MSRYIDADALIERCERQINDKWNQGASPMNWSQAYEQFEEDLLNATTVDAVQVVRCSNFAIMGYA